MELINTLTSISSAPKGKGLDVDTPIATINGWSKIGDLRLGDSIFDETGAPCDVVFVTKHVTGLACYALTFSDGSEIVTDAEHQWCVDVSDHGKTMGQSIKSTIELLVDYRKGNRNTYCIPVTKPLKTPKAALAIDPYVFGMWLGDGHSRSARIYCHVDDGPEYAASIVRAGHTATIVEERTCNSVRIDVRNSDICPRGHDKNTYGTVGNDQCAECGRIKAKNYGRISRGSVPEAMPDVVPNFNNVMRGMGFLGSGVKYIPCEYLRASYKQRLALLQGLMDTDGYISKVGRCEFVTTSDGIYLGLMDLLSSLGIKHTVKRKQPRCRYKGQIVDGKMAYRFSFMVYSDKPVFRLRRKIELMVSREGRRTTETERRFITDISAVDTRPVCCIQVDSNSHLFLVGQSMIPTHSTEIINQKQGPHKP